MDRSAPVVGAADEAIPPDVQRQFARRMTPPSERPTTRSVEQRASPWMGTTVRNRPDLPKINDLTHHPTAWSGKSVLMKFSHASACDGYRSSHPGEGCAWLACEPALDGRERS